MTSGATILKGVHPRLLFGLPRRDELRDLVRDRQRQAGASVELARRETNQSSRSNGLPSISFHCFFWASVSRASI